MDTQAIYDVESITLSLSKTNPLSLLINVTGHTITGGWTGIKLSPRVYVAPPINGIWEFDLVGVPPSGTANQLIMPVAAEYEWKEYPMNLKGVKVYSANNYKTSTFHKGKPAQPESDAGIQIIKFEAWVNTQPVQPAAGGTLVVSLDYNSNDHDFHSLTPVVPQGINPKRLMLELTNANEMIYILNPRHNNYSQSLNSIDQYSSIELYYGEDKVSSIIRIPVVA